MSIQEMADPNKYAVSSLQIKRNLEFTKAHDLKKYLSTICFDFEQKIILTIICSLYIFITNQNNIWIFSLILISLTITLTITILFYIKK